jgi:hypothetical protein
VASFFPVRCGKRLKKRMDEFCESELVVVKKNLGFQLWEVSVCLFLKIMTHTVISDACRGPGAWLYSHLHVTTTHHTSKSLFCLLWQ